MLTCLPWVGLFGDSIARAKSPDTWTGFRNDGSGQTSAGQLPTKWSPSKGITWKKELPGYGQSSPVVWKDRAFVTAVEGPNKEKNLVLALDVRSGKQQWIRTLPASQKTKMRYTVSRAAPTPCVDADGLYVFFESGDLFKFSHAGKRLWSRSLVKEYGEIKGNHGLGSSLAQTEDALMVLVAHEGPSYLLAVDKKTGKNRWKTDRPNRVTWTTPVIARVTGQERILVSASGELRSYDASSGKEQWVLDGLTGNYLPSATVAGDRLVVGASISRRNPDSGKAAQDNCCLQLRGGKGKTGYQVLWQAKRATSYYATPLMHRGCVYFINRVGVLICLDLKTGKEHYAHRLGGPCWASPVGAGKHVYCFGKDGKTTIVEAGPRFVQVASNRLWEEKKPTPSPSTEGNKPASGRGRGPSTAFLDPIVYGTAVVNSALFLRTGKALYCIRKEGRAEK